MNAFWSAFGTPTDKISSEIFSALQDFPIVLCLGNDRVIEDCMGPLCGSYLVKNGYPNFVYGCLQANIDASNIKEAYEFIKKTHPAQKLLIIDASVSSTKSRLGKIVFAENYKPLNPRLKKLDISADFFLFGVCSTFNEFNNLIITKMAMVDKLAKTIADALTFPLKKEKTRENAF